VLVLAAALWLYRRDALTPATTVLSMGLAALAAATAQVVHLRPQWGRTCRFSVRTVARDHWHYGRWALASAAAMWFPLNVYYYVLPAASGLEAAGALKALLNLANPVLHSLVALGLLLTPSLVRQRARGGIDLMHRTVSRVAGICVLGSAVYLLLLWTFRVEAFDVLYGGRYQEYSVAPVLLAGALPLASSATITLGSALRALEQPRLVFWSYVVFCAAAVVAGAPLAATWGVTGALAGMLLSYVALVLAMWIFYGRARSRTAQEDREQSIWQESR
jgi:O-antigen/teichoic acid export membrane protein